MRQERVIVIGGGIAGSEAVWQLTQRKIPVTFYEMRPQKMTGAHTSGKLAELVCSNSLGSVTPHSASQILKEELSTLGSLILSCAQKHSVPAGSSLAVDREKFSSEVTGRLLSDPLVEFRTEELKDIPDERVIIIATGPLTSADLAKSLCQLIGQESLYFYDAISPIVATESLDFTKMYFASRYDKGTPDFLNIPLSKEDYETFVDDLLSAEVILPHEFEEAKYFESCLPIETIAARGRETLAFGPMKPVGLRNPATGKRPHAVIQLRAENQFKTAYNLVGFQTKMKYGEQLRIFRKLPGLEQVEFLRLGSMHRNTYIDSPKLLEPTLQLSSNPRIFIAGQLTGTEGYLESAATGLIAALNVIKMSMGEEARLSPPTTTILGALLTYITDRTRTHFQPTNVNLGLFPPLDITVHDRSERNRQFFLRSQQSLLRWMAIHKLEIKQNGEVTEGNYGSFRPAEH